MYIYIVGMKGLGKDIGPWGHTQGLQRARRQISTSEGKWIIEPRKRSGHDK